MTHSCGSIKSKVAFPFPWVWSFFLPLLLKLEVEPSDSANMPALARLSPSGEGTQYILGRTLG